jgi:GntR family carbon starvation induced transcriptional regulator
MTESLVDKIYESIHEDIISIRLQPGQRLHIAQLAERYEVGPGPVREALSRLLASEFVIAISQKGFRVAPISASDLHDIYKTRAHIEALALRLSIEQGDDAWEADMIAAYHRLAKFESSQKIKNIEDYNAWEVRHRMYNLALISACKLNHLLRIQQQLYNLTERYRRQWLIEGMKQLDGVPYAREQKKIMDAALARDVPLAIKLLYKHFEKAAEIIELYFIKNNLFSDDT